MSGDDFQSKAADLLRKVVGVGVGALFLTEESLRAVISELKIPKELISGILESATRTRKEFMGKLSSDVLDRVLNRVDPKALTEEILAGHEIELNIRVNFKPKPRGAAPDPDGA